MKITNWISNVVKSFFEGGQTFLAWGQSVVGKKGDLQLLKEYRNLVATCITAIAEDVAKYDAEIQKVNEQTGEATPVPTHPFLELLENPNPTMTQFELFEATQSFLELVGNCFWYLEVGKVTRQPKAIQILRPDRVKIVIDEDTGECLGYELRRDDGSKIPIDVDEMIHFKTFNPLNEFRGLGTVQLALLYIDTENNTSEFQNNYMKNQATPSGVVMLKGKVSKEAFKKLKKQWRERNEGVKNAGKTLFIRKADLEFLKMGLDLSELDMGGLKKMTREDVLEAFRVPEAILGKTDSSGLGRSNVETIEYIFAKRTIDPKETRIDNSLSLYVRRTWGDQTLYVKHKSRIPADKEAILQEEDKGVDRWMTRNEIRERRGLKPKPGGDELFVTFNQVPLEDAGEDDTEKSIEKKNIKKVTFKHQCDHDCSDHDTERTKEDFKKIAVTKQEEQLFLGQEKIERKGEKDYIKELNKLLDEQEEMVIDLLPAVTGEKQVNKQEVVFDGSDLTLEFSEEEIAVMVAILVNTAEAGGEVGLIAIGLPEEEFLISQATRDAIFEATERQLQSFNEETALKIQKQLAGGLADGEDLAQLTKRVESVYEDATGFRAMRIARTEAHTAVNEGTAQAWKQFGVKEIQWVEIPASCQFCEAMDGTIVQIGTSFVTRGDTVEGTDGGELLSDFKDVKYGDLHPNCDCRLRPVN